MTLQEGAIFLIMQPELFETNDLISRTLYRSYYWKTTFLMQFELLCIDSDNRTPVTNIQNLIYRLYGVGRLWQQPKIVEQGKLITDKGRGIIVCFSNIDTDSDSVKSGYQILIEGEFESLDPFRLEFIIALKKEKFDHIYILNDDVSQSIAAKIYPKLNALENRLRKYLILYSTTKLGPEWWKLMADSDVEKKVNLRINNETTFSQKIKIEGKDERLIEHQAFLIDFDDLGAMIYKKSAGFLTREDIVQQIGKITDWEDFLKFKGNIRNNIKKYFGEFAEIQFQQKWEYLKKIRNKIAHNNLFTLEDRGKSLPIIDELTEFLDKLSNEINEIKIEEVDLELIKEKIVKSSDHYSKVTKEQLAEELDVTRRWVERHNMPYIGLKNFATNILGQKGYDITHTYALLNELSDEGEFIKIGDIKDERTNLMVKEIVILKPLKELYEKDALNS